MITMTKQIFCNDKMVALLKPISVSSPLDRYGETVYMAEYSIEDVEAIPEAEFDEAGAWWRSCSGSNTYVPWRPRLMTGKPNAFWNYLCDKIGMSTEKNVCAGIMEVSENAGRTPISLFNYLSKHTRTEEVHE